MCVKELCPGADTGVPGCGCNLCGDGTHHALHAGAAPVWLELAARLHVWGDDCIHRRCCDCGRDEDKCALHRALHRACMHACTCVCVGGWVGGLVLGIAHECVGLLLLLLSHQVFAVVATAAVCRTATCCWAGCPSPRLPPLWCTNHIVPSVLLECHITYACLPAFRRWRSTAAACSAGG